MADLTFVSRRDSSFKEFPPASAQIAMVIPFYGDCTVWVRSPDGEDWRRFPPIARLVDRGDPANKTSDIGAMELYAASVIATDPFRLAEALRQ